MHVTNRSSSAYQLDYYIEKKHDKKAEDERKKLQKSKAMKRKISLYMILFFSALFIILFRYVRIYDLHNQINQQTKILDNVKMENEQTKLAIESLTDKTKIQEYAEKKLGLKKLTTGQIIYLNPNKENYMKNVSKADGKKDNLFYGFFAGLFGCLK